MAYQGLQKWQTSFLLLKVSEPLKFQMSRFCITTSESHSSKQAIFPHGKLTEKTRHILHNCIPRASKY